MAYVDLATVQSIATGQPFLAATLEQIRLNEEFLIDPPAASVYNSSSQTVAANTLTVLTADSESFDNDSMHSTSTNTSRLTIQTAGRYLFVATVIFATGTATERNVQFLVDGTTAYEGTKVNANASGSQNTVLTAVRMIVVTAGQYVEVRARQRTSGDLAVTLSEFAGLFQTR